MPADAGPARGGERDYGGYLTHDADSYRTRVEVWP